MTLIVFMFLFSGQSFARDWVHEAVRLTGESEIVRDQSIRRLKKDKNLKAELRTALANPHRPQALDVISALQMKDMLPGLMKHAADDPNGSIFLTINQLIDPSNAKLIFDFYHVHLFCESSCQTSGPAQVVIVDTFARTGEPLTASEIRRLFQSDWPEVQSSALEYVRLALQRHPDPSLVSFLKGAFGSRVWQLRLQAIYAISELPPSLRRDFSVSDCSKDPVAEVSTACLRLIGDAK